CWPRPKPIPTEPRWQTSWRATRDPPNPRTRVEEPMNNATLSQLCVLSALAFAADGCANYSVVGTSGEPGSPAAPGAADPAPSVMEKHASVISAPSGAGLGFNQPILGDVDGDGFDDFLVQTISLPSFDPSEIKHTTAYLFYGRAGFPQQLSTLD